MGISIYSFAHFPSAIISKIISLSPPLMVSDSVRVDTLMLEDMNDEYIILQYRLNGNIVQMDIDRKGSATGIDYILWDMDKTGD